MSHTSPAVELCHLGKTYRSKEKNRVPALKDLCFSVAPGEIVGLLGPNGAGKTTTVKMLMGFVMPDTGDIFFHGKAQKFAEPRKNTGYLPESFKPNPHLTVEEYLLFHCGLAGIPAKRAKKDTRTLLCHVGMDTFAHRKIHDLSKGMGQRVGLAQAFVGDPDLLILDEPTSGLDPVGRSEVIDFLITQKQAGKTIFFCSHILSEVERVCDRIGILVQGELKLMDTREALLEQTHSQNLDEVFKKEVLSCAQ
ncbi:ABC transporter ATP-binding protein [Desulfobacula phenolica]|uniref:ABC-2 type transport system ATP-binding protein n=1 Tax=Desulfobacula phenolica TaxID=90732 RepID=A0A1H2IYR5_9BACT|nr:ABC transporter ATP-binding protein [Desulfobacula phenolica]SDU49344.1 ABC-2 type transport system ATP-binding protein [Desulfobacula phenolica]